MIKGIVFDKDGTLFDFNATWGVWSAGFLQTEAGDDPALLARLADVIGYDLHARAFRQDSIVIAETGEVVARAVFPLLPEPDLDALTARMNAAAVTVPQVAAVPLVPLFDRLRAAGLVLGLATNDSEAAAQTHLQEAGIADAFDFIAGYDSGFGAKPAAGQLQAFCAQTALAPRDCVMVGDSLHDLTAGRAAGMRTVGVLTGPAPAGELAPHADAVLASIGDLPDWIARSQTGGESRGHLAQ